MGRTLPHHPEQNLKLRALLDAPLRTPADRRRLAACSESAHACGPQAVGSGPASLYIVSSRSRWVGSRCKSPAGSRQKEPQKRAEQARRFWPNRRLPGQLQGPWVQFSFSVPDSVRAVRPDNPRLSDEANSSVQVHNATVQLLRTPLEASLVGPATTDSLFVSGTDAAFPGVSAGVIWIHIDSVTGTLSWRRSRESRGGRDCRARGRAARGARGREGNGARGARASGRRSL